MASSSVKKIIIRTSDGDLFEVEQRVAMEFQTIKSFFEDNLDSAESTVIPLQVSSAIFNRIVIYCKKHMEFRANSTPQDEVETFDRLFVKDESNAMILDMILATNYLEVKHLFEWLCSVLADRIKNKSPEYVRNLFGVVNDFSPDEEEKIRKEHEWAFEGVDKD